MTYCNDIEIYCVLSLVSVIPLLFVNSTPIYIYNSLYLFITELIFLTYLFEIIIESQS